MRVQPPGLAYLSTSPELFTDRLAEAGTAAAALTAFRQHIESEEDGGTERRNVIVYYGPGGIGKSSLSERLELWFKGDLPLDDQWGVPPLEASGTARINLHGSLGDLDLTSVLPTLRDGTSRIQSRWPVFDLCFAAYWSATRPGEPFPHIRGKDEIGRTISETVGDVLSDLGSLADLTGAGTGSGLVMKVLRRALSETQVKRALRSALNAFEGFEDFLVRCAEEPSPSNPSPSLACEIASTLAWELAQSDPSPTFVVFLDTAERLSLDIRRTAERSVNSLIYAMPNVFFVVTGRNPLDWDRDDRSDLLHLGATTWPSLASTAHCQQHRVAYLGPDDSKTLIERGRAAQSLPIPDDVVDQLVYESRGLPQYLELARQRAAALKAAGEGRSLTVEDVSGSLASLVTRVLDDIPADERRAIHAGALFRTFDLDLIVAAAAVDYGSAERAVRRQIVDRSGESLPFRLHDSIREALRRSDHLVTRGWAERDWELASTRAAVAVRRMHDRAKEADDTSAVLDAIGLAITLTCDQRTELERSTSPTYDDWLSRAVVFAPSIQGLATRIPKSSRTDYGSLILDFVQAKMPMTPLDDKVALLRGVFDSHHPLRIPAGRHLGYAFKHHHRWTEALRVFNEVAELSPTNLNKGQRPQTLSMARRFREARQAAVELPAAALIRRTEEYAHGDPTRYFREIGPKMDALRKSGRQRELLDEQGDWLTRRLFFGVTLPSQAEIDSFAQRADLAGSSLATRHALVLSILMRTEPNAIREDNLRQLKQLDTIAQPQHTIGFRFATAELCDALVDGSEMRIAAVHREAFELSFRTRSWMPVECFLASRGLYLRPIDTQWTQPREQVVDLWGRHFERYAARARNLKINTDTS